MLIKKKVVAHTNCSSQMNLTFKNFFTLSINKTAKLKSVTFRDTAQCSLFGHFLCPIAGHVPPDSSQS